MRNAGIQQKAGYDANSVTRGLSLRTKCLARLSECFASKTTEDFSSEFGTLH